MQSGRSELDQVLDVTAQERRDRRDGVGERRREPLEQPCQLAVVIEPELTVPSRSTPSIASCWRSVAGKALVQVAPEDARVTT